MEELLCVCLYGCVSVIVHLYLCDFHILIFNFVSKIQYLTADERTDGPSERPNISDSCSEYSFSAFLGFNEFELKQNRTSLNNKIRKRFNKADRTRNSFKLVLWSFFVLSVLNNISRKMSME